MTLKVAATRVQAALAAAGLEAEVREFPQSTRTAEEAAAAIGCSVAQIAKSLIFKGAASGRSILVVASGANRVEEPKVAALIGEGLEKADAAFVRAMTGYAIGGVPPVGHEVAPIAVIDEDLLRLPEIWAAAGTPNAVFALTPAALLKLTAGLRGDIKRGGSA
ncbi:YbaK/EbsC family protein [Algihabitans albus]|uniref:YbaK/EbsC family protein n=1 Tax=Algihabitans albus TaxID=2164067 RepID=UPI000E5D414B|nr:YbaK/EbsC family protein [Algihabitans albus]